MDECNSYVFNLVCYIKNINDIWRKKYYSEKKNHYNNISMCLISLNYVLKKVGWEKRELI